MLHLGYADPNSRLFQCHLKQGTGQAIECLQGMFMTADELRARIGAEIAGDWSRTNLHGCDLRQCLVEPSKQYFEDLMDRSRSVELWLVLEEDPVACDGYKVVYDEVTDRFGLACPFISGQNGYLGAYGETFLEAFEAM